jgi:hypothetical protein
VHKSGSHCPEGKPAGSADLRGELVSYLARSREVETTADNIVVCAGFRTAITVLVVTLAARGASAIAILRACHVIVPTSRREGETPATIGQPSSTTIRATGSRVPCAVSCHALR